MAFANVSGHGLEPTVFWGGAGRQGSCRWYRTCLIPMGVWRDPDRSQPNENLGAIRIRKECGDGWRGIARCGGDLTKHRPHTSQWIILPLDFGPLMGVRLLGRSRKME